MKPIFQLSISRNGKPFIAMNNLNNELDFAIHCTRSISFSPNVNQVTFTNFPTPFLNDEALIKKADNTDIITIKGGYNDGKTLYLSPLITGQVAYYKGSYDSGADFWNILFVEATIKSNAYYNFLRSTYMAKPLKNVTWLQAIQSVYSPIDPASLKLQKLTSSTKLINLAKHSLFDFFTLLIQEMGIGFYFANNILYLVDPETPSIWFDLTDSYQIKSPAVLQETNPFRILKDLNPINKLQRIWGVQTVFNPNITAGVGIKCIDKYGNIKKGLVATVTYSLSTLTGSCDITFLETVQ